jgi:hypothetical protein
VRLRQASKDGVFPHDFYSTTNLPTDVRFRGRWRAVSRIEMDCGVVIDPSTGAARCTPIANVRKDVAHKLTANLVQRFRYIGVEDLNVAGMARGLQLGKSIMDAAMGEVLRQLDYKAPLASAFVVKADRFYPSSKTCSACNVVRNVLPLATRRWTCDGCGAEHDRDENAAKNLRTVALTGIACCHGGAGPDLRIVAKPPFGQELGVQAVN